MSIKQEDENGVEIDSEYMDISHSVEEIQVKGTTLLLDELGRLNALTRAKTSFDATYDLCINALHVYEYSEEAVRAIITGVAFKMLVPNFVEGGKWLGIKLIFSRISWRT